MANACVDSTCHFLRLPRELRDQIYGEVFFPGEKQPVEFEQDWLGLAPTAVRQIHPYDKNRRHLICINLTITRTCRQIHEEAEVVFYGTASFNLMYQDWERGIKRSYECLEKLPIRNRRLIRRIERKCYSEPYRETISLCDWKLFMTFLARECPNLHSLKLWGPGDRREGPRWVDTCREENEWVQAILQIRGLSYFDIPMIKGGVIYDYPSFRDDFLPWLRSSLLQNTPRQHDPPSGSQATSVPGFSFLQLPSNVRKRIYELLLLPPNRRLHPYLKPWYDRTTHNLIPLLRTCRFIQNEAERVLYEGAIFTSLNSIDDVSQGEDPFFISLVSKYDVSLLDFFRSLSGRLRGLIRSVRLENGDGPLFELISYLVDDTQVERLTLVISATQVDHINEDWQLGPRSQLRAWDKDFLRVCGRFREFTVETPDPSSVLDPACLEWLETGLSMELEDPLLARKTWLLEDSEDECGFSLFENSYVVERDMT